tara:strand:+ start:103 stop:411 length:309 start_codon:yes stop_codon:yes gene_type:complete
MKNSNLTGNSLVDGLPFVIEDDIPMPEINTANSVRNKYKFLTTLRVGQSFEMNNANPDYSIKGVTQHCAHLKKRNGLGFSYRTTMGSATKPATWRVRVWRTE